MMLYAEAVSYTHLDVYKRQALARPDAEEPKLEKVKPPRKPKKKGRKKEKLEKLPVKRTEYVLSEEELSLIHI